MNTDWVILGMVAVLGVAALVVGATELRHRHNSRRRRHRSRIFLAFDLSTADAQEAHPWDSPQSGTPASTTPVRPWESGPGFIVDRQNAGRSDLFGAGLGSAGNATLAPARGATRVVSSKRNSAPSGRKPGTNFFSARLEEQTAKSPPPTSGSPI